MIRMITELSTIAVVSLLALVPWHNITFMPTALLLCVAIGSGLAVVCIPEDRRSFRLSVVTALAGMGVGLLFTEWAIEAATIESASAAKAIAGILGFGGLPLAGMLLRLIDHASNNPTTWLGKFVRQFLPESKTDSEQPTGRALPPR